MHVWLIQIGEPIPIRPGVRRQRLTLLSEALVKRGHRVTRWGSTFDHITKTMLFPNDTEVHLYANYLIKLIKGLGYRKNISFRRYLDHIILEHNLIAAAKTMPNPDLILVATPPHGLAYKVVNYAKANNIPVIVDIRDQWPDIIVERLPKKLQSLGSFLFGWEFYKIRRALAEADAITAMMEELLQWGLNHAQRERSIFDMVFHIGTEIAETTHRADIRQNIQQIMSSQHGKMIFTFVGTFNKFYNPAIILKVAGKLQKEGREDIVFLLAGSGDYFDKIKSISYNLKNIHLLGWINHEEIMALLKVSDVGICPLNEFRPCFPNKVFIYLSAFLPIISSTPGEFQRLMAKHNLGIYYDPGDVEGLFQAVVSLADNTDLRTTMKNNVRKLFNELFNAQTIYEKFVDHIEYIAGNYSNKRGTAIKRF